MFGINIFLIILTALFIFFTTEDIDRLSLMAKIYFKFRRLNIKW